MVPLSPPLHDPTPFFDLVRGNLATELLCCGVNHLELPHRLSQGPRAPEELRKELDLSPRAWVVLSCALKAMNILWEQADGKLALTPEASEFLCGGDFDMKGYLGLVAQTPGVLALLERLKSNQPASNRPNEGDAFIYREGKVSAMDEDAAARRLTLALSGRARICGPALAEAIVPQGARRILDLGGGSGFYAIALVKKDPSVRVAIWERPAVLKVAQEFALAHGVSDRIECVAGDFLRDPFPQGFDGVLLSNILHDWDLPECHALLKRIRAGINAQARVWIHDVYLNDRLDGPLALALYSTALFTLTEGRAYSAGEYRAMLRQTGFADLPGLVPTAVHCGVLTAQAQ